jgi:hypothetical protein
LIKELDHRDVDVRLQAVKKLRQVGSAASARALLYAAADTDSRVGRDASFRFPDTEYKPPVDPPTVKGLAFPFVFRGRLAVALPRSKGDVSRMVPFSGSMRVYLVTPYAARLITDLNDLVGHVRIAKASDALAFVRLRTSLSTWFAWEKELGMEVVAKDALRPGWEYGDTSTVKMLKAMPNGYAGTVERSLAAVSRLRLATTTQIAPGYLVKRLIVMRSSSSSYAVLEVVERVTTDGHYRLRQIARRSLTAGNGITWEFPLDL